MLVALKASRCALQASLVYHIGSATLSVCLQVQQENIQAWQTFCSTSLKVTPSDVASGPAYWQGEQAWQSKQGDLYQHRLPQLGSRMQQLLIEAAAAWVASTEGVTLVHICGQSRNAETLWDSLAVCCRCLFSVELCTHCQCKSKSFDFAVAHDTGRARVSFQSDLPESNLLLNSGNVNTVVHLRHVCMYLWIHLRFEAFQV